ncbi:MAG TPA: DUF1080 domain-containing protein [Bryobacteraceae bacterium]|nr:DUF1080 domain-containing protein [Bryobacteraceae bacterium]
MRRFVLSTIALPLAAGLAAAAAPGFVPLFNGKSLDGWEVCNGKASYRVEKGEIVGTTAEGSPNSFLCTKKEYGDFVLEFETKTDPALNSGVQIRSHRYPAETIVQTFDGKQTSPRKQPAGRVYGYQVEIADEKSGASGGIYDEARRGWVHNIASDPVASKAFRDNQWNKYRVEARGDRIRTWINGVPCADLVDSMDLTGFVALQVHAYKGPQTEVRWRNVRIQDLGRHEWRSLTDGRTMKGWTHDGGGDWKVEEGAFHGTSTSSPGYLVSDESFKDVTARLKVKILKGNSGFFLRADPKTRAGYEVEIDSEKRTGGYWEVGGRNWVTGPEDNAVVVKNDWNLITASLRGRRIVFHVNGNKTVDIPEDTQGKIDAGRLAIQVHARMPTDVWFKDIEVLVPAKR